MITMIAEDVTPVSHRSKEYRPEAERQHHVALVLGQGVSGWVAHDVQRGRIAAMHWAPDVDAIRSSDLPRHPRSVTYVMLPEWSTLVPDGAFEPGTALEHLTLVHGRLPSGSVREEAVDTLRAQCLYVPEASNERLILERFPIARSLPLQAVMVNGARTRAHLGPVLLLHRGADRLDVAIADERTLLVSNSYPARTPEDILYFCLMATAHAGLRPDGIALRTGGTHLTKEDRDLLTAYFIDHQPAVPSTAIGDPPGGMEADRWLAAFEQIACVS